MKTLVFNGWAAKESVWDGCAFRRDRVFSYVEELDGVPARVLAAGGDCVLVGFSMGGSMALRAFLDFPDKVKGLVLVSTTACMMERPAEGWKGMSVHRRQALYVGTRMTCAGDPSPLFRDADLVRGLDYLQQTDQRAELLAARDAGRTAGLPVAIVQGERDGIVRPPNAAFLKTVFPQAEVTWVATNEHNVPVVAPEAVDAAVRRVLDGANRGIITPRKDNYERNEDKAAEIAGRPAGL